MTTSAHKAQTLTSIGNSRDVLDQARAEGRREETVYETWELLFQEGQYRRAAAWWAAEIQPTFSRA